ncbi:MAG TPA: ABC transporter permease [Vicinamibacterales bacterium]|nr:ABC transporter permease [Vicinamibacterales bacterium]
MTIGQWARRTWYLVNRRRFERELEHEMEAHRALMAEPKAFGNALRLREGAADVWGWRWLDDLGLDLHHGIRQLVRARAFAATAILTLTLGIGATTAIFSVVNSLLLRPLPVRDPDRLAILGDAVREELSSSYPVWEQIRNRREQFDGALALAAQRLNLARGGEAQFVEGLFVSGEFFTVLGVQSVLGRTLTLEDDRRGGGPEGPAAVISHDFWRRRFAGSPDVLGRSLLLDSVAFTIVGVMPRGFFGTDVGQRVDVVVPLGTEPLVRGVDSSLELATRNWLTIIVRLRRDQSADTGTAILRGIQPQIREAVISAVPDELRTIVLKEPWILRPATSGHSNLRSRYRLPLVVLLVVVGLVLLIACANIANLLMARAVARLHEMSVRTAIGASRARLVRMLLAEASLLAITGTVLGVALSTWLSQLLVRQLSPRNDMVSVDLTLDWRVLLFAAAVSIATALLFGAAPAWHSAQANPAGALNEQGRGRIAGGRSRFIASLVGAQLALSLVLVVGAGLFLRTFVALASQDLGFRTDRVLVVDVTAPMTRYTLPQLVGVYERVREAVERVPGVERAALSDITPLSDSSRSAFVDVPGAETLPTGDRLVMVNVVSPGWLATYGTRLLEGRDFTPTDGQGALAVALVNEAFARRFWKDASPVGRAVGVGGPGSKARVEIIGVVEDAVYRSLRDPAPPTLYTSTMQRAAARPWTRISILSALDPPTVLTRSIEAAVAAVDPGLTLQFNPLSEQVDAAMLRERLVASVSGIFGLLALLLASVGLYGITAYAVSRRRAEIGVRLALGAAPSSVIRLVMHGLTWPLLGGITVGAVLSVWLAQFVGALMWRVPARDPMTFAVAATILATVGALAGWLPARRASRIDPVAALRL